MKKVVPHLLLVMLLSLFLLPGCGSGGSGDGGNSSSDDSGNVNENSNPDAPILNTIGNKSVTVGDIVMFTVSASDPNGSPLTYTTDGSVGTNDNPYTETFSLATFDPMTRRFSWDTTGVATGDYYVEFSVMNNVALEDFETVRIRIQSVPVPPSEYETGRDLYINNCAGSGCHRNEENNTGGFPILCSSPDTIKFATETGPGGMPTFNFSDADESAISNYLNNVKPDLC